MWQIIKSYPLAALAAVLVHVLLILILMINIDWPTDKTSAKQESNYEVIEAEAVPAQQLEAREQRIREAERQQREAELARQRERQRQAELKKQAEEKKRQAALEKKRKAQEKKRREAEAQRQVELKKQREAAEQKRREEEARAKREAEEQRRREEQARQEREEQQRREQEQAQQALQEKLAAEAEAQARRERLAAHTDEINQYKHQIKERITRRWRIPATAHSGMRCEIMVRLLPGGEVASVEITQSSQDPAFDRSVEDAVYSASPLPVPSVESGLFNEFRELKFSFEPKHKR